MSNFSFRFMDSVGDGTGINNFIGDYSSSPISAKLTPHGNEIYFVTRIIGHIQDAQNMSANEYAKLGAALQNGIEIKTFDGDGNVMKDITDGIPITQNIHWGRHCFDNENQAWAAGQDAIQFRWTFLRSGRPLKLIGTRGHRLEIIFNDNFTGITEHRFYANGYTKKF